MFFFNKKKIVKNEQNKVTNKSGKNFPDVRNIGNNKNNVIIYLLYLSFIINYGAKCFIK